MASSGMLTEKLILALNSAKDVVKSEDSQIVKKLMTSLNNKESFSNNSTMDEIRAAVEARQQERKIEDEIILGVKPKKTIEEPADETTEKSTKETTDENTEEAKEEDDIMSKFKWVLISIGIFVFLIIVGSIFYWYFSSQPEETIMQPRSNIQPVSTEQPPQNVEVEPAQNYSYLPFMSAAAVHDVNKSNELEKQEQEAELKRIKEQQERLKQEEQQRIEEEKRLQNEQKIEEEKRLQNEQRIEEEKRLQNEQRIEDEKRLQEEQQRIRDDKEEQEELIKQSLDNDNKKLDDKNNSSYNMNNTAYTDTSSSSSESSDDENKEKKRRQNKKTS
jgi:flagellar basal body-associated protein FliL